MIRKLLVALAVVVGLSSVGFADLGGLGIIQSATTAGGGGIRVDLGSGYVTDVAVTGYSKDGDSSYSGWADLYYGSYGLMYTFAEDTKPAFDFVYAAEKELAQDVIVGIYTNPIGYDFAAEQTNFFSIFDVYLVLNI